MSKKSTIFNKLIFIKYSAFNKLILKINFKNQLSLNYYYFN